MNVLFDRNSLKVVGMGRNPLPFEIEVTDFFPENFTKTVSYVELEDKVDEEGKQLYLLPQEPVTQEVEKKVIEETTEETNAPVMIVNIERVPLLDDEGNQVKYEVMETVITKEAVYDEETGELISEEETEERGTGRFIDCYTIEEVEEQKKDSEDNPLYYKTETITEEIELEQEPLVITEDDERYEDGLEKAQIEIEKSRTVKFDDEPYQFDLNDILYHKFSGVLNESQYDELIAETFIEDRVDTTHPEHSGNTGFGFVQLHPNGKVNTFNYELSYSTERIVLLSLEADSGIKLLVNGKELVDEVQLDEPVDSFSVTTINETDTPKEIRSFAIGY